MIKINVIDLDKTLICYESFRAYVFKFIKRGYLRLIFLILKRVVRIISNSEFKLNVTNCCRKHKNYKQIISDFVDSMYSQINPDIFRKVIEDTDENTINILCSASISDYVQPLANKLRWDSVSSIVDDNQIKHNFGVEKVNNILNGYPRDKFFYNFAISDSNSDLTLLKMFNKYELVK